ncbi:hypothetical protein SmJEL517_g04719 [Synchytrium microbalum]|uniref:Glycogen debranching enzyme C-terminal domain-containing protein n=1 Tax=Synchytrium microbalum TaxID=1806994 RepID=A0A507BYF5_9FUNG|nr:uncharacterized protein SmJEL517_g04719 [Synchytrium microbalum]TPX32151.1 hypothetical protein SmJEL517_g04719 [Synchytrium microbalum]
MERGKPDTLVTYAEWDKLIHQSFGRCFFSPTDPAEGSNDKISFNPTFAPERFDLSHARVTLKMVEDVVAGPLGVKTLDPSDWAYQPVYDNTNDSADPTTAHGFNYHNGPECIWLYGYYLPAYVHLEWKAAGSNSDR